MFRAMHGLWGMRHGMLRTRSVAACEWRFDPAAHGVRRKTTRMADAASEPTRGDIATTLALDLSVLADAPCVHCSATRSPPESLHARERGHDDSRVSPALMHSEPDVRDAAFRMKNAPVRALGQCASKRSRMATRKGHARPAVDLRWTERMKRSRSARVVSTARRCRRSARRRSLRSPGRGCSPSGCRLTRSTELGIIHPKG